MNESGTLHSGAIDNKLLDAPRSTRIYIASFFDTRERLRPIRDSLWKLGYEVLSSWLDETTKPAMMSEEEFFKKLAIKDLCEVYAADLILLDTIDQTPRGGRENEFGFGLGRFQTKLLWIIGPRRTVFHTLADQKFESWDDCLTALGKNKNA